MKPETVTRAASQLNKTEVQIREQMAEPGGSGRIKVQMDLEPETVTKAASQLNATEVQIREQMAEPGGSARTKGQMAAVVGLKDDTVTRATLQQNKTEVQIREQMAEPGGSQSTFTNCPVRLRNEMLPLSQLAGKLVFAEIESIGKTTLTKLSV